MQAALEKADQIAELRTQNAVAKAHGAKKK
jgi:hypothetical protein